MKYIFKCQTITPSRFKYQDRLKFRFMLTHTLCLTILTAIYIKLMNYIVVTLLGFTVVFSINNILINAINLQINLK